MLFSGLLLLYQFICIDELFKELGKKYINSDFINELGPEYYSRNSRNGSFQLEENNTKKKKRKLC